MATGKHMQSGKNASLIHLIIALGVLLPISLLPVLFLENKPKQDPIAKVEELQSILNQLTPEARNQIFKYINVREDRLLQLPYERLEDMVNVLQDAPGKLANSASSELQTKLDKLLEKLDRREPIPAALQGVGIVEKPGARLPLELVFRDENAQKKPLGSYFQSGKPIILTLNYSDCPQLCHIQLERFVEVMQTNSILPGKHFEIVTVSINPLESPARAKNAKKNYLKELNASSSSWHFLTTDQDESIKKLAAAVGFNYRLDPIKRDYAHSSTLIFCTPEGTVAQYYQGIEYEPAELKRRIDEARQGIQVASGVDENYLNCKVIDDSKPYATFSMQVMKIVACIMAVGLVLTLIILWMIPNRRPTVLPPLQGETHT